MNIEYEIKRLVLTPGETLVVKIDALLTREQRQYAVDFFTPFAPKGVKVLVLDKETELSVLKPTRETTSV
jgi:hypothetical protein